MKQTITWISWNSVSLGHLPFPVLNCFTTHHGTKNCVKTAAPQNSWGQEELLEITNTMAHAGPPIAGCPGTCASSFWIPPSWTHSDYLLVTSVSLCSDGISDFSVFVHCFLACHWALLRSVWILHLLPPTIRCLYTLMRSLPKPPLLQAEQSEILFL